MARISNIKRLNSIPWLIIPPTAAFLTLRGKYRGNSNIGASLGWSWKLEAGSWKLNSMQRSSNRWCFSSSLQLLDAFKL